MMMARTAKRKSRSGPQGPPVAAPRLSSALDLALAWRRVKQDRPNRAFVTHPFLYELIEQDSGGWLADIAAEVDAGYSPRDCFSFHVPKPNWLARPGATLDVTDEVVFNAVLGAIYPQVWARLGPLQGTHDIAYQLRADHANTEWISAGFTVWRQWRERSLEQLQNESQFVLFADIAAFYENIDLPRLRSDVSSLGIEQPLLELLMNCLRRWAQPRGKGIPQGHSGSDILAKLYMNPVDQALVDAGFRHLRYVDDIRIFCRTRLEAKQALLKLNDLLRHRGLNLQGAKTCIVRADDARRMIDGVTPLIDTIGVQLRDELVAIAGDLGSSITLDDIERFSQANPDTPPVEVLERAFENNFSTQPSFDKTLFHYLLTRLGKMQSQVAVRYCLDVLEQRPDETAYVLKYLAALSLDAEQFASIIRFIESADAIFDFQRFEVVRWYYDNSVESDGMLKLCRIWAFDRNRDSHLRAYCIASLGKWGNAADLELIENEYARAATDMERAEIVCSLVRLEIGRRNAFYGRLAGGDDLVRRAIEFARRTR